ncbi:MAG: ferrous iron transport protein A [Acidobacteria bacterium]|nr:MAG: ferrous iron transport protein A [Acidobacteriota bacterium]
MAPDTDPELAVTTPAASPGIEEAIPLDRVEAGHCGLVHEVRAGETEIEQLQAMGVCAGRKVMLVKTGDPMILKVLGSRIGVSARLASQVMVLPCGGDMFGQS